MSNEDFTGERPSERGAEQRRQRLLRLRASLLAHLAQKGSPNQATNPRLVDAAKRELQTAFTRAKGLNRAALRLYMRATQLPGYEATVPAPVQYDAVTDEFIQRDWMIGFETGSSKPGIVDSLPAKQFRFPLLHLPFFYLGHKDIVPVHYCLLSITETAEGVSTVLHLNGRPQRASGSADRPVHFGEAIMIAIDATSDRVVIGRDLSSGGGYWSYPAPDTNIGGFIEQTAASVQHTLDLSTEL